MADPNDKELSALAEPAGLAHVYLVPREALAREPRPRRIDGLPVSAIAAHPTRDDVVYVTTGPPSLLQFTGEALLEEADWYD